MKRSRPRRLSSESCARLQEGCAHLLGFGPNGIHDHNMSRLLRHRSVFCKLGGERGLACGLSEASARSSATGSCDSVFCKTVGFRLAVRIEVESAPPGAGFDVTKETRPSPLFPIRRIVRIDTGARTQHAEKGMLNGIDHNPGMSAPDGQVARLRTCDSPKFVDPRVKVRRARVFIRETGALIEFVDKVGAVGGGIR